MSYTTTIASIRADLAAIRLEMEHFILVVDRKQHRRAWRQVMRELVATPPNGACFLALVAAYKLKWGTHKELDGA